MTKRTRYTGEFKRQAVELLESRDKPAIELARELGIRQNQLYKWREEIFGVRVKTLNKYRNKLYREANLSYSGKKNGSLTKALSSRCTTTYHTTR